MSRSAEEAELVEVPEPEAGPGEIVVAMRAVGLCGSDVTPWYVATKAPVVLGHETAGVVTSIGADVARLAVGDRVFVHHHAPCGECPTCVRGESVQCPEWKAVRLHPGGLAEHVRVESSAVERDTLKLPDEVGFDDAALIEPVACCVKAVARGEVRAGDTVAVVGLGSNGILLGLIARRVGARLLIGCDPDPARRRIASGFGFDHVLYPWKGDLADAARKRTNGRGADVVFVIPTGSDAVNAGLEAAAPGGRVVLYSPVEPGKTWSIAPSEAYFKDVTFRFSYSCGPQETRIALGLIAEGLVKAERLVTHRLPFERAAEGLRLAASGGEVLKVLIEL